MKKYLLIIITFLLAVVALPVLAVNVTVPQSNALGAVPIGNTNGTYNAGFLAAGTNITITTSTPGQITITASGGSATAGGNNNNVQYNNATALAGSNNFAWINASNLLTLNGTLNASTTSSTNVTYVTAWGQNVVATNTTTTNLTLTSASNQQFLYSNNGVVQGNANLTWDGTNLNVPNNVRMQFGGGSGNGTGIKTGTDGTFLWDTGANQNLRFKAGDSAGVTSMAYTPDFNNMVWQAFSTGTTTQKGDLIVNGVITTPWLVTATTVTATNLNGLTVIDAPTINATTSSSTNVVFATGWGRNLLATTTTTTNLSLTGVTGKILATDASGVVISTSSPLFALVGGTNINISGVNVINLNTNVGVANLWATSLLQASTSNITNLNGITKIWTPTLEATTSNLTNLNASTTILTNATTTGQSTVTNLYFTDLTGQSCLGTAASGLVQAGSCGGSTLSTSTVQSMFGGGSWNEWTSGFINASTSVVSNATVTQLSLNGVAYTWPIGYGASGTVLSLNATGQLSWGTAGGTTNAAGNTNDVQYANGTAFAGADNFAWINGSNILSVNGSLNATTSTFTNLNASTTILTNATTTGQSYVSGNLYLNNLTNSLLSTDAQGKVVASTTLLNAVSLTATGGSALRGSNFILATTSNGTALGSGWTVTGAGSTITYNLPNNLQGTSLWDTNLLASTTTTTNLTITGVTSKFLSTDASGVVVSGGTASINQVPYASASNVLSGSNNFAWINGSNTQVIAGTSTASTSLISNLLGIGTTTPLSRFDLQNAAGTMDAFTIASSTGGKLLIVDYQGHLQMGTTTMSALISVQGTTSAATLDYLNVASSSGLSVFKITPASDGSFVVASSTSSNYYFKILAAGGFSGSGTPPTLSSCGTTPTINSQADRSHGTVTVGTGAVTGCVNTFVPAFTNAPSCTVTSQTATSTFAYAVTNTAITVTDVNISGKKYDYMCEGNGE